MVVAVRENKILLMKNEGGYTFVELIVSITILAIVTVPILSLFVSGYTVLASAGRQTIAANLCREKIEAVKVNGYDFYMQYFEQHGANLYREAENPVEGFPVFRRVTRVWEENVLPDPLTPDFQISLLKIIVQVFWEHQGAERAVQMETNLARR